MVSNYSIPGIISVLGFGHRLGYCGWNHLFLNETAVSIHIVQNLIHESSSAIYFLQQKEVNSLVCALHFCIKLLLNETTDSYTHEVLKSPSIWAADPGCVKQRSIFSFSYGPCWEELSESPEGLLLSRSKNQGSYRFKGINQVQFLPPKGQSFFM